MEFNALYHALMASIMLDQSVQFALLNARAASQLSCAYPVPRTISCSLVHAEKSAQ